MVPRRYSSWSDDEQALTDELCVAWHGSGAEASSKASAVGLSRPGGRRHFLVEDRGGTDGRHASSGESTMSWEYRRFADGRVEILKRRSFLKLAAISTGILGLIAGGGYFVGKPYFQGAAPRSAAEDDAAMDQILTNRDVAALYRIVPHYHRLDRGERMDFWAMAAHLKVAEMLPFAEVQLRTETDQEVLDNIEAAKRILERVR